MRPAILWPAIQTIWGLLPCNGHGPFYNDAKNADKQAVLDAVSGSSGCHNCHSQGSCTHFCPNELDPMKAIAGLKRATTLSLLKGDG